MLHTIVFILAGTVILVYLSFFQGGKPIQVYNTPLQTVEEHYDENGEYIPKDTFYTGETLNYAFDYCKHVNVPVKMYGTWIDTVKIDMPVVEIKSPIGCGSRISSLYKVPKILPSGKYHFEVELVYQVNPIRQVHVKYRTQDFQIINNSVRGI